MDGLQQLAALHSHFQPGQQHFWLLLLQEGLAAALCAGSAVMECGSPPSGLLMKLLSAGGGLGS
jgi:hypothetical protein